MGWEGSGLPSLAKRWGELEWGAHMLSASSMPGPAGRVLSRLRGRECRELWAAPFDLPQQELAREHWGNTDMTSL